MSKKKKGTIITPNSIQGYEMRGTIGEGAFSVVKLVYNSKMNQFYACKIIAKERLNTKKRRERFEYEIRIQQMLRHPGIVKICDLLSDSCNYYIILEFCTSGELLQYLVDKSQLSENEARPIIYQILDALNYIHKIGICHRDIKLENILLDKTGRVKLSDFGLSKLVGRSNGIVTTPCGSPCYASPECISGNPYNGKISDMWSVGVILFACVAGQLPWTKRNQSELFHQIKTASYIIPSYLSNDCKDLIKRLMALDVNERITAGEALQHPWFKSMPEIVFPDTVDRTMDISLKHIDKFFCNSFEDLSHIKVPHFDSDSTIATIPNVTVRIRGAFNYPNAMTLPMTTSNSSTSAVGKAPRVAKLTKPIITRKTYKKKIREKEEPNPSRKFISKK